MLIDDIKTHYEEDSYPPAPGDLDMVFVDGEWVDQDYGTEEVSRKDISELRWGTAIQIVYRRGDEYVAVEDVEPATEMQNWGDYGEPEIYPVKPVEETIVVTKYVPIES